ncbi:MAG: helix-turn-helix domain-containing protein [Selenomonadaceae bacterium]|nr:helix-turn-helix domain-containing protein [Selenomonadaceae bacterium]
MEDDDAEVLTVEEACEYLRIGKTAMYQLLKSGRLPAMRIHRKWMIPRKGLRTFVLKSSHLE